MSVVERNIGFSHVSTPQEQFGFKSELVMDSTHICVTAWLGYFLQTRWGKFMWPRWQRHDVLCAVSGVEQEDNPARRSPLVLWDPQKSSPHLSDTRSIKWDKITRLLSRIRETRLYVQRSSDDSSSGVWIRPSSYRVFFCNRCCLLGLMWTEHT